MGDAWKTREVLENCLTYITTPRTIAVTRGSGKVEELTFWPHARGFDCGPCDLRSRCGRLPCMRSDGLPYGLPLVNWQTSPATALIADLRNQLRKNHGVVFDGDAVTTDDDECIAHPI